MLKRENSSTFLCETKHTTSLWKKEKKRFRNRNSLESRFFLEYFFLLLLLLNKAKETFVLLKTAKHLIRPLFSFLLVENKANHRLRQEEAARKLGKNGGRSHRQLLPFVFVLFCHRKQYNLSNRQNRTPNTAVYRLCELLNFHNYIIISARSSNDSNKKMESR